MRSRGRAGRAPAAAQVLALAVVLGGCTLFYEDRSRLTLAVEGPQEERDLAARRLVEVLEARLGGGAAEVSRVPQGAVAVVRGAAVARLREDLADVVEQILEPPAGPGWRLEVATRLVTLDGLHWLELQAAGGVRDGRVH